MGSERKALSAAELDEMTPDERAAVVKAGIVGDLSELPDGFRERVERTGERLAEELRPTAER
jgi:hypothetical protein